MGEQKDYENYFIAILIWLGLLVNYVVHGKSLFLSIFGLLGSIWIFYLMVCYLISFFKRKKKSPNQEA